MKRHEALTRATAWMNLENMLSEKSQTPKDKYCLILFIRNVQWRQIPQDGKQINGCQGLGRRDTGVAADGDARSLWGDGKVLKLNV